MIKKLNFRSRFDQLLVSLSPRRKLLTELRATWAQVGAKDGWLASRHFDLTRESSVARFVDDKTWTDLEFPAIFASMDTAVTPIGSQALYRKLRAYVDDPGSLAEQYGLYRTLRSDQALREEMQLKLAPLRPDSNADIADYVFGPLPEKPAYHSLILAWSLLSIATPIAVFVFSLSPLLWLLVLAINFFAIHVAAPRVDRDAKAFRACAQMLRVAEQLAGLRSNTSSIYLLNQLADTQSDRESARKALRWFSLSQGSVVSETLAVIFNVAFVAELVAYIRLTDRLPHVRPALASTFDSIGALDASIAIASFLERCPDHCLPEVADRALIEIDDGYHPLISQPVRNTVYLESRSALITGSNMAGKTTFIKMVGTNIILGRTLGFCLAAQATLPRSSVMASIRGEHSVASGKSHYFAEIEAVLSFIRHSALGECRVFLIDELFSGTNTVERIAAARAVLLSLSRNAQVLVTTHDVELQRLVAHHFDLYHFQENPDVEGFFDYQLRPGATEHRNAIRLLERLGFPPEIVQEALGFVGRDADAFLQTSQWLCEHGGEKSELSVQGPIDKRNPGYSNRKD